MCDKCVGFAHASKVPLHRPKHHPTVTRLEVIDHRTNGMGRMLTIRPCRIELAFQDDERTLKVFVDDPE